MGDASNIRAPRTKSGPFETLRNHPEFRDLVLTLEVTPLFNLSPTLTARENVEIALAPTGLRGATREEAASTLLATVGLGQRGDHLPSQLSGGEQQRVAIARALANGPDVLLADEPTGNIDSTTGEEIIALLRALSDEHDQTVVLITHDLEIAAHAPRVLRMQDGRLLAGEPAAAA